MSKDDFLDQLAYGTCTGSVEAASPDCVDRNPGKKPEPCPYKVAKCRGRLEVKPCNCCGKCRNNCNWMAQVLQANERESARRREDLLELLDKDNE